MRHVAISVDQLRRPQPGGIGTYVRGLLEGMRDHVDEWLVQEVGPPPTSGARWSAVGEKLRGRFYVERWTNSDYGVRNPVNVIHATSLAGPFGPVRTDVIRSVTLQDFLWRDEPQTSTERGRTFHESRFQLVRARGDIRIFVTTSEMRDRVLAEGVASERVFRVTLGLDHAHGADSTTATALLAAHGVLGPFTLCFGTIEPRKNLERLVAAHAIARAANPELGPLVLVGPRGWGDVDTKDAVVLGALARSALNGLITLASAVAYVPLAEGWGLPPLEALHWGARVVASRVVPSVQGRADCVLVDPLDVESIAAGLKESQSLSTDSQEMTLRRESVAQLTWGAMAREHIAGWQ